MLMMCFGLAEWHIDLPHVPGVLFSVSSEISTVGRGKLLSWRHLCWWLPLHPWLAWHAHCSPHAAGFSLKLQLLIRALGYLVHRYFCMTGITVHRWTSLVSSTYVVYLFHCSLTGHYLWWRMPPFMHQCWGLPHRLAQCMRPQGWGKLVNAALLSLIHYACVNVRCATLLSIFSLSVGPACVQAWSSNTRGRACRPSGKGSGEERILSDVVPVYLYCLVFSVSVSLDV